MQTVNTRMIVTFDAGWQAQKDLLRTVATTSGRTYPNIIEFYKKDVRKAGKEAVRYLRKLLNDEIYSKYPYPTLGPTGNVRHRRSKRFLKAATLTGPRREVNRINMGIFNLVTARGMKAHKTPLRYYDILEFGHKPYSMTRQQQGNWAAILRKLKKFDSVVAGRLGPVTTVNRTGSMHPGIKPYRFFRRTAILLDNLMTYYGRTLFQRYKSYAEPAYKPKQLISGVLPGLSWSMRK